MSHCYSVGVGIGGEEKEICTSHVPGNEHIRKALDSGKQYELTKEDVKRAVDYYMTGKHKMKETHVESPALEDIAEPTKFKRKNQRMLPGDEP